MTVSEVVSSIKSEAFRWAQVENLVNKDCGNLLCVSPLDATSIFEESDKYFNRMGGWIMERRKWATSYSFW